MLYVVIQIAHFRALEVLCSVGVPLFNDATMVAEQSMIMGHLLKYAHRGEHSPRRVICLTDTWTELVSNASFRGESRSKAFTHYNISVS